MIIRRATKSDESKVLEMYDQFIDYTHLPKNDPTYIPSTSARTNSREIYNFVLASNNSRLFVADNQESIIGLMEIHKVPRIKKGSSYGELELLFVSENYHGKGVAKELMQAAQEWARNEKLNCIRLYSGHELHRSHSFYEKMGFKHAGKTYVLYL